MKKISTILITAFITMMLLMMSITVEAKGSGFGGRSSSSFSRSSRSVSIRSSSSSSKSSGSKSAAIKVTRDNVMSSIGKKGAQGDAAGVLYKSFQANNSSPLSSSNRSSKINKADIDKVFTPQYRSNRRTEYYGSYRPQPSTHYNQTVYANHSGGYGIWDLMLFNSIMDNVGDRGMYYHHQNDPSFQQWRTDANAACAAGDTDVCDKLKDLDREMAEYKAKGVQINPNYVTPGVDPDIYEANNIDVSKLSEIKICTGAVGSDYSRYAALISKVTKLKVVSVPTNGSMDTLSKLASGACSLGFVQDDITSTNLTKLATMNQFEVGLLVCNKAAQITEVKHITDKTVIFVGSDQTGSQYTLNKLREMNGSLNKAIINNTQPVLQAVGTVQNTPNSCLFGVSTPDFTAFKQLDETNKFENVPIFSWDLDKKQPYTLVTVDVNHYKNLTQDKYKKYGMFTDGGTDTIGVKTSLVAPQSWIDQNKQLFDILLLERTNLQTSLQ